MYSLGGEDTTPAIVVTADKTNMSAETTAAVTTANLTGAKWQHASVGNPSASGYFAGGRSTTLATDMATADKLTFSNDTTAAATTANLSLARAQLFGLSERITKGYFAGGLSANVGTKIKVTDKITFSGDSTAAVTTADLSQARSGLGALSEGTSKGYWAGGSTGGGTPSVNTADKITFSGDSTAALASANLSVPRFFLQAGSDGSTKGYWAGGQTGGPIATTDKITFSTDTTAAQTSASLNNSSGASGSDGNKMFAMGGSQGAQGQKITFATDLSSGVGAGSSGNLSSSRTAPAGVTTAAL